MKELNWHLSSRWNARGSVLAVSCKVELTYLFAVVSVVRWQWLSVVSLLYGGNGYL